MTALRPWLLLAAVALLGASWWHGHMTGARGEATRQALALAAAQADAMRNAEMLSRAEAERLAAVQALDALYQDLEDQARADTADSQCTFSPGRVRRLNLR